MVVGCSGGGIKAASRAFGLIYCWVVGTSLRRGTKGGELVGGKEGAKEHGGEWKAKVMGRALGEKYLRRESQPCQMEPTDQVRRD